MGYVPTVDRDTALDTLRDLCGQGFAGLDQYDDSRFVIDAPEPFLSDGERALDAVGAHFLKSGPIGAAPSHVAALLPTAVFLALGLDSRDAPRLVVPLASRRVDMGLNRLIDDIVRSGS